MKLLLATTLLALVALPLTAPPAAAVGSVCTPGTLAFIDPMPRACAAASTTIVCATLRTDSTLAECVPLP